MQDVFEKMKQRIKSVATEADKYAPLTRVVSTMSAMDIDMMKYRRSIFQLSLGGYKNGGDNESNDEISGE